jgi:lysyl-tRNA synthetase, class II
MRITNDLVQSRFDKLARLKALGVLPYAYGTRISHRPAAIQADPEPLIQGAAPVEVAGRLTALRGHGKTAFGVIQDQGAHLQLYFRQDDLGPQAYGLLELLDLGDWIAARGPVFRTKTGEVTVAVQSFGLLAKALLPPPAKWHGLKDVETRYRQRYADLLVNDEVRRTFVLRSRIVSAVRRFLDERGYLEVETPVLQPIYGGAFARPFTTHHHALGVPLYLRISDELYLKRLIVGGLDRVYEIGKDFRNEGIDKNHNPEFTMLEFYEAYADYEGMMRTVEALLTAVRTAIDLPGNTTWRGQAIDWTPPFGRTTYFGALSEAAGCDVMTADLRRLRELAAKHELEMPTSASRDDYYDPLFGALVEPTLQRPTFVVDYPREISPLAKQKRDDPRVVERFELYVAGMELANAFSEQNDPLAQEEAMRAQEARRAAGDEEAQALDHDYVRALMYGMPPTGGLGMGIDRLAMLFLGAESIRDVILFPQLKPEPADVPLDAEVAEREP